MRTHCEGVSQGFQTSTSIVPYNRYKINSKYYYCRPKENSAAAGEGELISLNDFESEDLFEVQEEGIVQQEIIMENEDALSLDNDIITENGDTSDKDVLLQCLKEIKKLRAENISERAQHNKQINELKNQIRELKETVEKFISNERTVDNKSSSQI